MHDAFTIGIPVFAILVGVVFNQQGLRDLRGDMNARFNAVEGRLDRMQSDLSQFYKNLGEHEAKIDILMADRPHPKA